MKKTTSRFAEKYRNLNATFVLSAVFSIFIWALYQNGNMPALIKREKVNALVIEIKTPTNEGASRGFMVLKLQLPNNKSCKIVMNVKYQVKINKTVPLIIELYDDKTSKCMVDYQAWAIN